MYKIYCSLTCLAMLILTSISYSQNLYNGPESVAFDTLNNRYLVSNVRNGTIVQVDSTGTQSYFATDLGACLGNCIAGDTFYVTNGNAVLGYDLTNDQLVMIVESSALRNLDGMTTDTSGYLYVLKTIEPVRIFKIDISNQTFSTFVSSGLTPFAQDLIFDKRSNRILVATWAANHPIQAVNLLDSTISTVITDSPGLYDGITMDADGFVYAASHNGGNIYMWDSSFSGSPRIISTGHIQPAGLDYNIRDNILAVPNFAGNTVDFIPCNIPALGLHGWTIDDSAGDGDGHADPGETGEITVTISNMAWDAHDVTGAVIDRPAMQP